MTDEQFDNLTVDRICILAGKNGGKVTQAIRQHSADTNIPAEKLEMLYASHLLPGFPSVLESECNLNSYKAFHEFA